MQIYRSLKVMAGRRDVTLGSEKEVYRVACPVDSAAQILLLAGDFDIGLVEPPAHTHRPLAAAKNESQDRQDLQ